MAAANAQILKEYLLSLGFKIDETTNRRFDSTLGKFDLRAVSLAKSLLGVAAGAQVMVGAFARSMEKLYYASKRTDSTVENIQALEYAGRQLGLGQGTMTAALESMARALRSNPGLTGLLESLGVQVTGRDKSDVLTDLVTQLNKMPFYVSQQYASLFGISPDDLLMLEQGIADLQRLREERKKLGQQAGLDVDKAAQAAKDYANALRQVEERLGILKDIISVYMLPYFKSMTDGIIKAVDALNSWLGKWSQVSPSKQLEMTKQATEKVTSGYWDFTKRFWKGVFGGSNEPAKTGPGATSAPTQGGTSPKDLFSRLEAGYGLRQGLLDAVWAKESRRGDPRYMKSPAGAEGHFQFMPETAKGEGLKNPYDLVESATAAARYLQKLHNRYGGNEQMALAAYNWGMGNVDKLGKPGGKQMPWETKDYVATISGRPMQIIQQNTFQISTSDPILAANRASQQVDQSWADITRNTSGVVDTP